MVAGIKGKSVNLLALTLQVWPSVDGSHGARLVARCDIARGAEVRFSLIDEAEPQPQPHPKLHPNQVTISYIDSNERANVRERRAELAEYGFVCACAKCAREAGEGKPKEEEKKKKQKKTEKGEKGKASAAKRKRTQ